MLEKLRHFFSKVTGDPNSEQTDHDVRVATCAIFVELARIDGAIAQEELNALLAILQDQYGLSREYADALIAEAEKELDQSVDLWQFARLINENYSNEEKKRIITLLWQVVYTDGKMDKYEHYLMDKLRKLLRISHAELIEAKLKVLHS